MHDHSTRSYPSRLGRRRLSHSTKIRNRFSQLAARIESTKHTTQRGGFATHQSRTTRSRVERRPKRWPAISNTGCCGCRVCIPDWRVPSAGGLLGSVRPPNVWALASGATTRGFFRSPHTGRPTTEKGVGDGAFAQGSAGTSASAECSPTPGR